MNKKALMDFGKTVLAVAVGVAVYDTVKPMLLKATVSEPSEQ